MQAPHDAEALILKMEDVVSRGSWPDYSSKPLATYICREVRCVFRQCAAREHLNRVPEISTIRDDPEMGMPKLMTLLDRGTWPGEDSKELGKLLLDKIKRTLEETYRSCIICNDVMHLEPNRFSNMNITNSDPHVASPEPDRSFHAFARRSESEESVGTSALKQAKRVRVCTENKKPKIKTYYQCAYKEGQARKTLQPTERTRKFKVGQHKRRRSCNNSTPHTEPLASKFALYHEPGSTPACSEQSWNCTYQSS